jgi:predicted membrane-bound spermidine synthase
VQQPLGKGGNAIFFASGFAGLIYESIWTQYLKLFLGHAAYAQTLVLAIFMGGMAIGAALVARRTLRISKPLAVYAAIEAALGVLAFAFHPLFTSATAGYYDLAFVRHIEGTRSSVGKWSLAALLILPQSILLGATFPIFASAVTRNAPAAGGDDLLRRFISPTASAVRSG